MDQKNNKQLRLGIFLNYLNLGLGNIIPIFYTPIMLSLLGKNEYGLYKLSSSVTSYLSLLSLGLSAAITRYLIKSRIEKGKEEEERFFGFFVLIFNAIAVLTILGGIILISNLQFFYSSSLTSTEINRMKIIVSIMVLNMAFGFSLSPYMSVVTSHEHFIFYQSINILLTFIGPLINVIVLYFGAASISLAIVTLSTTIFSRICYQFYTQKNMDLRPCFKGLPLKKLPEILCFSFWIFLENLVSQLYNATDIIMISLVPTLSTAGVATYNIGTIFNTIVISLTTCFSNLLVPQTNKMVFSQTSLEELTNFAIHIGRLQGLIMFLIVGGFLSFGLPFIDLYIGKNYQESFWVAIFLIIPNLIPLLQSIFLNIIIAQNKHQFRSVMYLFIAILNILGTWYMMKFLGVKGAALISGIALLIGNGLLMNIYYSYKIKLDIKKFWIEISKLLAIPIVLTSTFIFSFEIINYERITTLIFGILFYTLLYCVLNWLYVMHYREKKIFIDIISHFFTFLKK